MYAALAALCAVPGRGRGVAAVGAKVAEAVAAAYSSEANEDAKVNLLEVLQVWLPRCETFPPAALTLLSDGIKDK
eukprot:451843-Pyramimonas_sp.AAC.1